MSFTAKVPTFSSTKPLFSLDFLLQSFKLNPTIDVPPEEPESPKEDSVKE